MNYFLKKLHHCPKYAFEFRYLPDHKMKKNCKERSSVLLVYYFKQVLHAEKSKIYIAYYSTYFSW